MHVLVAYCKPARVQNGISAKTIAKGRGLDHGVFIPFKIMFPSPFDVPIVEVSMDRSLDPLQHIRIGQALEPLRYEVHHAGSPVRIFSRFSML